MLLAAQAGLVTHLRARAGKGGRVLIDQQLAAGAEVAGRRAVLHQRARQSPAVQAQLQQLGGRARGGVAAAGRQETQGPAPLRRIGPQAQAQRHVAPRQPARQLAQHRRIGQRRDEAVAQLRAIGLAGADAGLRGLVQHGDVMAVGQQRARRGQADDASADDDDVHRTATAERAAASARASRRRRQREAASREVQPLPSRPRISMKSCAAPPPGQA